MKFRAGIVKLGAVGALGLGFLLVPIAANAAPSCPSGYACYWEDAAYKSDGSTTDRVQFQWYIGTFYSHYYDDYTIYHSDNTATSLWNNGRIYGTRWYDGSSFAGLSFYVPINRGDSYLGDNGVTAPGGHNDKLSSACFTPYC